MIFWKDIKTWSPDFRKLAVAYCAVGIFFGVQMTVQSNFIVERLGIEPEELGMVEALREVPGFLNFVFLAVMIALSPRVAATLSLCVLGVGVAMYSQINTIWQFAIVSVIWSIGFHAWIPLGQTMAILFSPKDARGQALGQLRSAESLAWLLMIGGCYLLFPYLGYGGLFVFAGVACVIGAVSISRMSKRTPTHVDRSFLMKKKFWLYYMLQFLQGCRKQIFITFALFALVKVHGVSLQTIIALTFVNQLLISVFSPWIGRMVDKYGERRMMTISYVGLAMVFVGYGVVDHKPTLYALYCIDNFLFFGAIALTTYVSRLASEEELKPTLSMGVTWNHVSSVLAPLLGGFAWAYYGYEVLFYAGAVMAVVSLGFAQLLPGRRQAVVAQT